MCEENGDKGPLLALGMITSPFNFAKRSAVRATMLRYNVVQANVLVFRFVIGSSIVEGGRINRNHSSRMGNHKLLNTEVQTHSDTVQVDALDGAGVAMECPAAEKTLAWLTYAMDSWPNAAYYGKTEDDTYIQFQSLALELFWLRSQCLPHVMYGLMGICLLLWHFCHSVAMHTRSDWS